MAPAVAELFEAFYAHLRGALEAAYARHPAADRLLQSTLAMAKWAKTLPDEDPRADRAWEHIGADLHAVAGQLAQDPAIAELLTPPNVLRVVLGAFAADVHGPAALAQLAEAWPLRLHRLRPGGPTLRYGADGIPELAGLNDRNWTDVQQYRPLLRWQMRVMGQRPSKEPRSDKRTPAQFDADLLSAMEQLRTEPEFSGPSSRLEITAIADLLPVSREYAYKLMRQYGIDRDRLRAWQPGQPIPKRTLARD